MSARDIYHEPFVRALQKDGWKVTHEPLTVKVGTTDFFIDVGAERFVTAERNGERIAVEIKSFIKLSAMQDLKEAIGQFILYEDALEQSPANADRLLFVAIRTETFDTVFSDDVGKMVLRKKHIRLVVFDSVQEVIKAWMT